jgi:excisionase family DNA binding protein
VPNDEILTVEELAAMLKMKRESIHEMTRKRGQERHRNPLPICRVCGHIRFRRSDIERWLDRCAKSTDFSARI